MTEQTTMTVRAAAEILDAHENTVRNWMNSGRLAYVQTPGGHKRPLITAVQALIPEEHPRVDLESFAQELESAAEGHEDRAKRLRALAKRVRKGDLL